MAGFGAQRAKSAVKRAGGPRRGNGGGSRNEAGTGGIRLPINPFVVARTGWRPSGQQTGASSSASGAHFSATRLDFSDVLSPRGSNVCPNNEDPEKEKSGRSI